MLKKCSFLQSKTGKNDVNIYYRANVIINLMNPNINRHKSPTQRFIYPNYTPYTPRVDKNGMHSSTQESTKEELSLREQQNLMREVDNVGAPINSGFNKVKKEDMHLAKNQINPLFIRNNSEKVFVYKPEIKLQTKINASPDKNYDYFGFKNGPQKYHKDKFKNQHKLSDSADSEISHNSNKGQGKTLKFLTKKNQRKLDQGQLYKHENIATKNKPTFLQQKSEIYRRAGGHQTRLQQQTPRNESPSHSPSRKQDLTNPSHENTLYKRSSLSPQNKLSLNRQISHQTIGVVKNNYTPKKSTTPLKMPHKDNINQKSHSQIEKSFKQKNFYPKKQSESNQFSFCRQNLAIGHLTPQRKSRSLLSLPLITVIPLSLVTSHPVSFIILDKLAQNKSSSIYKCLHSSTNMVYCIKKSAVQSNNISQLIVEHKIGTTFSHANLVKAFATFYDRSCLYLLMQYMQDRSLSKILRDGLCSREYYLRHSKSIQSIKFDTRQSFWQRPRIKEENFYSPYKNSEFLSSAAFTSHYPSDPHADRLYLIKEILQQILRGLKFLHENGIMHRDLKPDNIFVSNGNYKIGDFGSCTYNESQEYIGTLDYAAPEIMLKQRYDKSVDMWSLGCLAYQLDVGSPPFYHENRGETIRRIVNMQYNAELISDLQLKKFISKLLVRSIRITAADALIQVKKMEFGTSLNQMQMQRGWEK